MKIDLIEPSSSSVYVNKLNYLTIFEEFTERPPSSSPIPEKITISSKSLNANSFILYFSLYSKNYLRISIGG
jgi:hypothetical protein